MSSSGSITVAVRVRPPTECEAARLPEPPSFDSFLRGDGTLSSPRKATTTSNVRSVVEVVDDRILTFDPPDRDVARAFSERGFVPPGSKRYKDRRFMFDRVFTGESRQIDVYEGTTQRLLDGLLDGYNSTVFAYGATGCGKTYTISGADNDPGIIYLAMADLFQRIEDKKDETSFEVVVTFLEIYNEEIRDLLAEPGSPTPRGGLAIREDKHVKVVNLTELRPLDADQVKDIVLQGNQRRTQSPTHANETSSRSHAVLQVHVIQSPRTASTTETRTMATLSIIDLAGSERASATKNMGERMVEGANINKSLLALGNCINALCESGGTTRHIPYRNSKLTRLLKFSLGGNCKTVMIVCVAPTSLHFDDTHNALVYAERATKIKTKVVTRNVLNVNRHVGQYVEAINRLNEEVAQLKGKLADRQLGVEEIAKRKRAEMLAEVARLKADIRLKVDQNKQLLGEGARCRGLLDISEAKLALIRSRLDPQTQDGRDELLEAEKLLFTNLASRQEAILRSDSTLATRIRKSTNADSLLDAMLHAVTERRVTGRLDDMSVQNVQLQVNCARAEIEQFRMEERTKAFQETLAQQTSQMINLVAMLTRCTVMLREGARTIQGGSALVDAASLQRLADANDEGLTELLGSSIPQVSESSNVVSSLYRHPIRKVEGQARPLLVAGVKPSRRSSVAATSPRKTHRSPRKPRLSVSKIRPAPKRETEKKSVRWKDEDHSTIMTTSPSKSSQTLDTMPPPQHKPRNPVSVGSESEWEDEKTDDSVRLSFTAPSLRRASGSQKRARNGRLDPAFLRAREPMLERLLESDDEAKSSPFSDQLNQKPGMQTADLKERGVLEERRASGMPMQHKASRRVSGIGPMRSSRSRRRSSVLNEPRVTCDENVKPTSGSTGLGASRRKRSSGHRIVSNAANTSGIAPCDSSSDAIFRGAKPMWR